VDRVTHTELPDIVARLATTVTGCTVVAVAVWWLVGPRVREYLRVQLGQRLDELTTKVDAVATRQDAQGSELAALRARQDATDARMADWLAQAGAELSLTRAARILAAGQQLGAASHVASDDQLAHPSH
jgi:hypothetical protein